MVVKNRKTGRNAAVNAVPGTSIGLLEGLLPMLVPVATIQPDEQNPRTVRNLDALVQSLKEFGLRKPIIVNRRDSKIEAGHQTFAALLTLGAEQVPVLWADDSRTDALRFNIADNRTSELVATWDDELLLATLAELQAEDGLDGTGFFEQLFEELRLVAAQQALENAPALQRAHETPGTEQPDIKADKVVKDELWFYAEFYGRPELFAELKALLAANMRTEHDFFEALVRGSR